MYLGAGWLWIDGGRTRGSFPRLWCCQSSDDPLWQVYWTPKRVSSIFLSKYSSVVIFFTVVFSCQFCYCCWRTKTVNVHVPFISLFCWKWSKTKLMSTLLVITILHWQCELAIGPSLSCQKCYLYCYIIQWWLYKLLMFDNLQLLAQWPYYYWDLKLNI